MPTLRPILEFPDPRFAPEDGIVALGGNLLPETLRSAYLKGIFPWPQPQFPDMPIVWFSPDPRGVLFFKNLHISASLERFQRRAFGTLKWEVRIDTCFEEVIRACGQSPRPGQAGTWITEEMVEGYCAFHRVGHAHSVEVWEGGALIGGIYGVDVNGMFSAESMFYRKTNASKIALLALCEHLQARGATWIDIQMVTPTLAKFGATNLSRASFLRLIAETHAMKLKLF